MKLVLWKIANLFHIRLNVCNEASLVRHSISIRLLKPDVLSWDYMKNSIQINSLGHIFMSYDRPCVITEESWCYWCHVSYVQCPWNSSKAVKLKHIDYWVWTVSELLRVICGSELPFESSGCFYFLQELTLSFELMKSQSICPLKARLQPLLQSENIMILGLKLPFELQPRTTSTAHVYECM